MMSRTRFFCNTSLKLTYAMLNNLNKNINIDKIRKDKENEKKLKETIKRKAEEFVTTISRVRNANIKNWNAFEGVGDDRKKRIKSALSRDTCLIAMVKFPDHVIVLNDGKTLKRLSLTESYDFQMAFIFVEAITLVLEVIGVPVPHIENDRVIPVLENALKFLQKNQILVEGVERIYAKYKEDDNLGIMLEVLNLVFDAVSCDLIWDILSDMGIISEKKLCNLCDVAGVIYASSLVISGGAEEIAELMALLVPANLLMGHLDNLSKFSDLRNKD